MNFKWPGRDQEQDSRQLELADSDSDESRSELALGSWHWHEQGLPIHPVVIAYCHKLELGSKIMIQARWRALLSGSGPGGFVQTSCLNFELELETKFANLKLGGLGSESDCRQRRPGTVTGTVLIHHVAKCPAGAATVTGDSG